MAGGGRPAPRRQKTVRLIHNNQAKISSRPQNGEGRKEGEGRRIPRGGGVGRAQKTMRPIGPIQPRRFGSRQRIPKQEEYEKRGQRAKDQPVAGGRRQRGAGAHSQTEQLVVQSPLHAFVPHKGPGPAHAAPCGSMGCGQQANPAAGALQPAQVAAARGLSDPPIVPHPTPSHPTLPPPILTRISAPPSSRWCPGRIPTQAGADNRNL